MKLGQDRQQSFSLAEVVLALGIVSFSILATAGLLVVGNDTNKSARDETFAAQLAQNEFDRIRSLSSTNFPSTYTTRYFGNNLADLGTSKTAAGAMYELKITFVAAPTGTADKILNAEVRYPVQAPAAKQNVVRFTILANTPP